MTATTAIEIKQNNGSLEAQVNGSIISVSLKDPTIVSMKTTEDLFGGGGHDIVWTYRRDRPEHYLLIRCSIAKISDLDRKPPPEQYVPAFDQLVEEAYRINRQT